MHWHPINPIHSHTVAICRIVLCCCRSHLTSSLPSSQFYWHLCPRPRRQSDRKVPTLLASAVFQAAYTSWAKSRAFQHLKLKLSWKLYIFHAAISILVPPACLRHNDKWRTALADAAPISPRWRKYLNIQCTSAGQNKTRNAIAAHIKTAHVTNLHPLAGELRTSAPCVVFGNRIQIEASCTRLAKTSSYFLSIPSPWIKPGF